MVNVLNAVMVVVALQEVPQATPPESPEPPVTDHQILRAEEDTAPSSIDNDFRAARTDSAGVFPWGPTSLIAPVFADWERVINEATGIETGMRLTTVFQAATASLGPNLAGGGDWRVFGRWYAFNRDDLGNSGSVYFRTEQRFALGGIPPAQLGSEIGSLWGTTDGFNVHAFALIQLYWQQRMFDDALVATIGKLDPDDYYNAMRWADDYSYFLNRAFSSNPARDHPGNGLGANLKWRLGDEWYLTGGIQDAQGSKTTAGFDTFFGDFRLFSAAEVGFTPKIDGLGQGHYRLTYEYTDSIPETNAQSDWSINLSMDQEIVKDVAPFVRYARARGTVNDVEQIVAVGIGIDNCFSQRGDAFGFGVAWGEPATAAERDQWSLETFYRLQLAAKTQFTVGVQAIVDPTFNLDEDVITVLSLRLRIDL